MHRRTERLLIRPWRSEDLEAFFDLRSRPDVVRYLYEEVLERSEAVERLAVRCSNEGPWKNFAVERSNVVIGEVGLQQHSHDTIEIGYTFHPDHQGHGYATEAAAAVVAYAFDVLHAHRVMADLDARNLPSARLLERLHFRREAHFLQNEWVKGEWTDTFIYALLSKEYHSRLGT